jgi:hypothetical protein
VNSVRRRWALTAALLLVGAIAVIVIPRVDAPAAPTATSQMMQLDPRVIDNLTRLPQATALSGQEANDMVALQAMVEACPDYAPERRAQMIEQIALIVNPALLTRDMIIALGANPPARLLRALAQVTAIQWRLLERPDDSCLVPIGRRINELLAAIGEAPEAAFEGGSP